VSATSSRVGPRRPALPPPVRRTALALAGLAFAGALVAVPWLLADYAIVSLTRIIVLGLLAVSVALLTGVAGLPTLGQTAPFLVGAYTAALLTRGDIELGIVQLAAAAGAGALFAAVTAPLVVAARGVVVLMITLALGELTSILANRWKGLTNGTDGMLAFGDITPLPGLAPLTTDRGVYLYVLVVTAVLMGLLWLALRSPAGTLLRATRDSEQRMRASGHPVAGYLAAAYVVAGALAGVAGALLVTLQDYISPADGGFDVAALVLLAVVIGGASSMLGAFGGAALVVLTRDWLAGPLPCRGPLLLGVMFVLCVYLLPHGLLGNGRLAARDGRLQ
jgi:branched-chain amino acid transport system permease protein